MLEIILTALLWAIKVQLVAVSIRQEPIEKSCRKIALFTGPKAPYIFRVRTEGYFAALMEAGILIDLRCKIT